MIKLVASDSDGTLVPEGTTSINPEFYEIIRKLKEKELRRLVIMHFLRINEKKTKQKRL